MKRFKEKTVIVTDAESDIGRATAIRFANEGANVTLVGRSADILKQITQEFPRDRTWIHADNFLTVICDISVESQVQEMIKRVVDKFGNIDVLVNTASLNTKSDAPEPSDKLEHLNNDKYVNEILYVSQQTMPHLINSKGNIVNVCSGATTASITDLTHTLASKYNVDGVRVNAVNPNTPETNTTDTVQNATPSDIAAAVTFLASDEASMVTGADLPVNGSVRLSN